MDLKGLSFLCKMTLPCGEYWTCWWGQSPWTSLWQLSKLGCRWWACRWTCNWKKASMWKKRSDSWKTENEVKLVLICWTIYVLLEEGCKVWKLVDTKSGSKWFITIHVLIFEDEKIDGYKKLHLYRLNSSAGGMFSLKPEIKNVIFSIENVATFCFVCL